MKIIKNLVISVTFVICGIAHSAIFKDIKMYYPEMIWKTLGEKFRMCRIESNNALPIYSEKAIKIYFKENSDVVSNRNKRELLEFMNEMPNTTVGIDVQAHADHCGNTESNKDLSLRRGNNAWDVIKHKLKGRKLKITGNANGESKSHDHSKNDKFVKITFKYIKKRNFKSIAMLDISGSLGKKLFGRTDTGYTLEILRRLKFKKGTIVYVPRDIRYQCDGTKLKKYTPKGDDFYNHARYLIAKMLRGKKIKGFLYTDYGDVKRNRSIEKNLKKIGSYEKILWYIL